MGQHSIGHFLLLFALFPFLTSALDWNSDIVTTDELKRLGEQDALHQYYGKFVDDREMFPSLDSMKERVGNFEEVNSTLLINHNYNDMTLFLKKIALEYPQITHLYSAGKSVEERDLWVMIISDNPREHELLEPEVKIVANMHGNEVVGREACLYLIDVLTKNYGKNDWITRYVNDTRLHLMPSMNPDGYERGFPGDRMGYTGRENARGIDLNRNFPAQYPEHIEQSGGKSPEPETEVMMKWLLEYPFILSMNLHGGSLVANYPWDDSVTGRDGEYTPTKDDVLFVGLAYRYARAHRNMWKTGRRCGLQVDGDTFLNGVTNGAGWLPRDVFFNGITNGVKWYHLAGGMQDWQYIHSNVLEITIEMGCFKFPTNDMLPQLWSDHEFSILSFLEMTHIGVKGIVQDENGKPVANATVGVENGKAIVTTKDGEYWRVLAPGDHELTFSAYGLETEQVRLVINGTLIIKNITLPTCGTNEDSKKVIRRGRGDVRIAVVGVNPYATKILRQMAMDSCTDETYVNERLSLIIVPDGMALKAEKSRLVHDEFPAAVLAVADGNLESVVFSAGDNVPKIFHKEALERSLNSQLGGNKCDDSDHPLHASEVAQLLDDLAVPGAFQVGVGLGCDRNSLSKQGAAVAGILKMLEKILTRDAVDEFSVKPSANPSDHFAPSDVLQATSAAMPVLEEEKGCARKVFHPELRMTQMGTGLPPYTLVMSLEKKTETLLYEMASSFCDSSSEKIRNILARSTLVFLPSIPHTQLNCHDYGTLVPFEKLFSNLVHFVPQVDFVMMFGSGGLKVRYINETSGISYRLAEKYRSIHSNMNGITDICTGIPGERETIKKFAWDDLPWEKIDAMLVQTGCCYENGGDGKLWPENEEAIVESLLLRTKGLLIHTDAASRDIVSTVDSSGIERKMANGSIFLPLEDGHHVFRVRKNGEFWADVSVEISSRIPFHIREIGSRGSMNVILISMFSLAFLLVCCFIVRGRFVGFFNRKGLFPGGGRGRDGFERIPLYMNDEDDEDTIVDMNKL
ncbi:unnamed protein product, partial [Mesorhabditis belari]|uniref:Peptidase M14 carboxypeptidase A domain-containing protein n=1 Tax=Mesorhabditis belari TaxID=2138241 RepID=A0AAF3EGC6_9BILA